MHLLLLVTGAALAANNRDNSLGLRVEVYDNSVMRGKPRCITTLLNGFNQSLSSMCGTKPTKPCDRMTTCSARSLRITGTLTPPDSVARWYAILFRKRILFFSLFIPFSFHFVVVSRSVIRCDFDDDIIH